MKRNNRIVLLILHMIIIEIILSGCGQISISPKQVRIELGGEVSSDISDYVYVEPQILAKVQDDVELDVSGIDSMTVGEYEAIIYYRGNKIISKVSVSDTMPPEILLKDAKYSAGSIVSANDLAEVKDFSKVTLKIICEYPDGEESAVDFVNLVKGKTIKLKAVDESGNEAIVETVPDVYEETFEEENHEDRSYDSFLDFPYEMDFADEKAYQYIQKFYSDIHWSNKFEMGDLTQYDFYKEKYKELIDGQKPFFDSETGTEMFLNDFEPVGNLKDTISYFFFDMDQDNAPEICLQSKGFISIFKYDIDKDQFLLWKNIE